jgi:hypothetical protein
MAQAPRKRPPAKDFALPPPDHNRPGSRTLAKITTQDDVIRALNERYDAESRQSDSVDNLVRVGELLNHAMEHNIIPRRGLDDWLRASRAAGHIRYTESYCRMARRFFSDKDDLAKHADWYRQNESRMRFRVSAASGVVFLRDCSKAHKEYLAAINEGKSPDQAFKAVDTKFPSNVPGAERQQPSLETLNASKRIMRLEALLVEAIARLLVLNPNDELANFWATPAEFLDWSYTGPFTCDQNRLQLAVHRLGAEWPKPMITSGGNKMIVVGADETPEANVPAKTNSKQASKAASKRTASRKKAAPADSPKPDAKETTEQAAVHRDNVETLHSGDGDKTDGNQEDRSSGSE